MFPGPSMVILSRFLSDWQKLMSMPRFFFPVNSHPYTLPNLTPHWSISQIDDLILFCVAFSLQGHLHYPLEPGRVIHRHTTKGSDTFIPWICHGNSCSAMRVKESWSLFLLCLAVGRAILGQIQGSLQLLREPDCPDDAKLPDDNIYKILSTKIRMH